MNIRTTPSPRQARRQARALDLRARNVIALVAVTGGLLLTACGDDDDVAAGLDQPGATATTAAPEPDLADGADVPVTEVDVTAGGAAGEFTFTTDLSTIEAGRVRVNLTNEGALDHQAMLLRLDDGVDVAALAAAGSAGPDAFLGLVAGFGGPNAAGPGGGRSTSTQDLEPGNYLLACIIPDANGVPHMVQGMVKPFTVTEPAAPAPDPAPLEADAEVSLVDFGFEFDDSLELEAGSTLAVTNDGEQPHEILAYRINDDATIGDVTAALAADSGPPPFDVAAGAGLGLVRPGGTAVFTLPDAPGRYALLCFIPDVAGDLAPHFAHGMVREVQLR